jgi:hypothetical protein
LTLVIQWIRFVHEVFAVASGMPAMGVFVVALVFTGLALAGGVAAVRDVPIVVVLAGGLSLIPVGFYLMLFPGPTRWVGLLDVGMLVIGVALVRADRIRQDEDLSSRAPPPPGSARPSSS